MKTITPYLLKFALSAAVLTLIFRFCLSHGIQNQSWLTIILSSLLYFATIFSAGWYFGKKDHEHLPIFDIGFRFHFTNYVVYNIISLLWFELGFASIYERKSTIAVIAVNWGIFLLLHAVFYFWIRKRTINGMDKDDLFE
jgi:hypothetical protein